MRFSEPQSRVITAAQARALGISSSWLSRQIQAGHWQRLYQGVYVTHSGPLSWFARAHAALLIGQPNAYLSHETAWFLAKMQPSPPRLITVSINRDYALRSRPRREVLPQEFYASRHRAPFAHRAGGNCARSHCTNSGPARGYREIDGGNARRHAPEQGVGCFESQRPLSAPCASFQCSQRNRGRSRIAS